MSAPVWTARTGSALDPGFAAYAQSVEDDAPYLLHDLAGSVAHVAALHAAGLLGADEARTLVTGLQGLAFTQWDLDPELEDVHMNVEDRLTASFGATGRKVHTGRSRNDQVATCIALHAREGLLRTGGRLHVLAQVLADLARAHASTPWAATTHGQPAQPATLGFLLLAHAWRVQDAARSVFAALDLVGESALGSGAVAGSTLPLRPDVAARLLGLRPPRNALLATGTRDVTLTTCRAAHGAGHVLAGLAEDLLRLYTPGALVLPDGFTSGSSLMPQKRNPDALELARGHAKALAGPLAAVEAVTSGLGLGYMRDLQVVKPHQHRALETAAATADLLAQCLGQARFDAEVLAAGLEAQGLTATDAAEALVLQGIPFRDAYEAVAQAHAGAQDPDGGQAGQAGLEATHLAPDPARRDTPGGPAPRRVTEALAAFQEQQPRLDELLASATTEVEKASALLETPPEKILAEAA